MFCGCQSVVQKAQRLQPGLYGKVAYGSAKHCIICRVFTWCFPGIFQEFSRGKTWISERYQWEIQEFSWKTPGEKLVFATFPPAAFHQGKTCFPGFHLENTRGKAESPPGRISPGFPLGKTCFPGPGRARHFSRPFSPGSPQHPLAVQKKQKCVSVN